MDALRRVALGLIAIADEPGDDDDARLRKRVGVIAGYLTIVAPLTMPPQASFRPIAWVLGIGLSIFSVRRHCLSRRTLEFANDRCPRADRDPAVGR